MKTIAAWDDTSEFALALQVYMNPFSIIGIGPAVYVKAYDPGNTGKFLPGHLTYQSIKDFLTFWVVFGTKRHEIPIPFIKREHLLGDVVASALSLIGVRPTKNCGCPSRHEWFNFWLAFVPWKDDIPDEYYS